MIMAVSSDSSSGGPVGLDQLLALNQEISALVRAGIPLELGLSRTGEDQSRALSRISNRLAGRMSRGQTLTEALADDDEQFPRVYRTVVEAGIRSGRLTAALEAISRYATELMDLRQKIGMAFLYPLIVVVLAYGLTVVVTTDLAYRFLETYQDLRLEMPWAVRFLVNLADTTIYCAWIPPAALLLLLVWWSRTGSTQLLGFRGLARPLGWIPGVRRIGYYLRCANFAELLGLFVEHEVPLPESIVLAADTSGDRSLQASARVAAEATRKGETLRSDLPGIDGLPPYLRWLIVRGHQQGELGKSLRVAAETYRRQAVDQADWLKLTFPVIACVVIGGGATLFYALTLFLPLVDMLWGLSA
jgi:general secretion pathway protein F